MGAKSMNQYVVKKRIFGTIPYILLIFLLGVSLLPLVAMLGTSFRSFDNLYSTRTIFPRVLSLDFYGRVLSDKRIYRYLWNSLRTGVVSSLVTIVIAILGGYSMARFRKTVPGIKYFIFFILAFNMFPTMQMLIPLYLNFAALGFTNKPYSLMLVYPAFNMTMSLMIMESFISGIPYEMEEAGRIDGCSRFQVIIKLVLPVAAPGIATALVLAFNHCWNEFLIALLLIKEDVHRTMPIGLNNYVQENVSDWGSIMACASIMLIPVLAFLNILQKHIVSGLTMGSVKG